MSELTPEQEARVNAILSGLERGGLVWNPDAELDMSHMTCYNCGMDISDIDPMTVTAEWFGDVLYLQFECDCEQVYEITLTAADLRDRMARSCL